MTLVLSNMAKTVYQVKQCQVTLERIVSTYVFFNILYLIMKHASQIPLHFFMLVSHCGEYMANGLTNTVRHEFVMIANDRQTFVAVRKHLRSFMWCCEYRFLKFARKAYSYCFRKHRNIFILMARHL